MLWTCPTTESTVKNVCVGVAEVGYLDDTANTLMPLGLKLPDTHPDHAYWQEHLNHAIPIEAIPTSLRERITWV